MDKALLCKCIWIIGQLLKKNPWYNVQSNFANPDAQWGYDFNHDSDATRELVDSINAFWMTEYQVDGFRFDFTKGFSNTPYGSTSWGSNYDADRIRNLKRMSDEIWQRNEDAIIIFEHLADNSEETELANYGICLWGNMNYNYMHAGIGEQQDLSWGVYSNRNWNEPNLVSYMESHDEERIVYILKQQGYKVDDYNIRLLSTALDRQELNSLFFIPLPGPKMIWQFGELGYDYSINYNGRIGEKPILWSYTTKEDRIDLFKTMSKLNYLKQNYEEFKAPTSFVMNLSGMVKSYRMSNADHHVVAVGIMVQVLFR